MICHSFRVHRTREASGPVVRTQDFDGEGCGFREARGLVVRTEDCDGEGCGFKPLHRTHIGKPSLCTHHEWVPGCFDWEGSVTTLV